MFATRRVNSLAGVQQKATGPCARPKVAVAPARRVLVVRAASGLAHPGEESQGDTLNFRQTESGVSGFLSVPSFSFGRSSGEVRCGATGGEAEREDMGSGRSLSSVLSPRRMAFVMPRPVVQGPKLDDGSGGSGIGKHNHNGGGGGDGDDDDDDFFADDDGEGDGEGESNFRRTVIAESYDKLSIACVFAEWMRTLADLPLIIRRSVEMGLYSSAQLVRFFSMDVRPSMIRSVSRTLPPSWARDFVGRLMADPAFVQKMVLESTMAAAISLYHEYRVRGDKFVKEIDLALINTLGLAAATGATTWLVAPSRSYGSIHKFAWQQALDGLPNHVFDTSGPLRQYSYQARAGGFLTKMAELSAVGAVTGTVTSLLSSGVIELHKRADASYEPSVPVPSVGRSSAGLAAFFAISANTRYQLLGGFDRYLMERSQHMLGYLGLSAFARAAFQGVGEMSRPWWQGLPQPQPKAPAMVRRRVSKRVARRVPRSSLAAPAVAAAAAAGEEAPTAPPVAQVTDQAELSSSSYELPAAVSPAVASVEQQTFEAVQQMQQQAVQQAMQEESEEAPRYRRSAPQGRRQRSLA